MPNRVWKVRVQCDPRSAKRDASRTDQVERKGNLGLSFDAQMGDKQTMNTRELIEKKWLSLPALLQGEGCDFARYLRSKDEQEHFNGPALNESALSQDRTAPEEDAAWAHLQPGKSS